MAYAMRTAEEGPTLPDIHLLPEIEINGKSRDIALFGPAAPNTNEANMQKHYWHSAEKPDMTFESLTSSEQLQVIGYDIPSAKEKILNPRWIQLARIARTPKGVAVNVRSEEEFKQKLDRAEEIPLGKGKIYLGKKDFGFAEYDTFTRCVQTAEDFAQGGLANILEHTRGTAPNFKALASDKQYTNGVNVWGFDIPEEETLFRVVSLNSCRGRTQLDVSGDWGVDLDYVFGGSVSGEVQSCDHEK